MSTPGPSAQAVLTPPGRGGIAVIRCVGPAAASALAQCFRPAGRAGIPPAGAIAYGHVVDADGRPLDEVILHRAGAEAFEVNCHGGPAAVKAVCDRLESLGLAPVDADRLLEIEGLPRLAREARQLLRRAHTPLAARILLDQLSGALAGALGRIRTDLAAGRTAEAAAALETLRERWLGCGRFLADPPRIVIAGRPNAGKSTLFNRLAGAERAITSPAPGTTRDYVEADSALEGMPVVLVDTAGLREAAGGIEREGVERARREFARAALVVYLIDVAEGMRPDDETALAPLGDRAIVAYNKIDALFSRDPKGSAHPCANAGPPPPPALRISALTGEGIVALTGAVLACLGYRPTSPGDAVPFTGEHAAVIEAARRALAEGRKDEAGRLLHGLTA